jgi:hypothetical protein
VGGAGEPVDASTDGAAVSVGAASESSSTRDLERVALLAAEAGRWDVALQYGREIEARRLAGSNVVPLERTRRS